MTKMYAKFSGGGLSRRTMLKGAAATGAVLATPNLNRAWAADPVEINMLAWYGHGEPDMVEEFEALNNVKMHAHASEAAVHLSFQPNTVSLEVSDNGRGFDSDAARNSGGMGLVSIRERMEMLGGSLDIRSAPGGGTRVKVSVAI